MKEIALHVLDIAARWGGGFPGSNNRLGWPVEVLNSLPKKAGERASGQALK